MGVNKINDEFNLLSDIQNVKKTNILEDNLLNYLRSETSKTLLIDDDFELDIQINKNYSENMVKEAPQNSVLGDDYPVKDNNVAIRDLTPQALLERGLKGELALDEILLFLEIIEGDNLLKYGLSSYYVAKDED